MMGADIGHLNIWMMKDGAKSLLAKKSFDHGADLWFESGAYIGTQTNFAIMIEGIYYIIFNYISRMKRPCTLCSSNLCISSLCTIQDQW